MNPDVIQHPDWMDLLSNILTGLTSLSQRFCPRSKWPTINFIGLNELLVYGDYCVKIFFKFFRGEGPKRGLNFRFFEKNSKIKCCRAGGLNPDLPGGRQLSYPIDYGYLVMWRSKYHSI